MAEMKRYGKPNLTNLPSDLGIKIFQQIRNTPPPDEAAMQQKRNQIMAEIDAVLARDYAEGNTKE